MTPDECTIDVGGFTLKKSRLMVLFDTREWRSGEEIDVALWMLRRRAVENPSLFSQRVCVMDSTFAQCVSTAYLQYFDITRIGPIEYHEYVELYVNRTLLQYGKAWKDCDRLLFPFSVCNSHWIVLEVNLVEWKMYAYDSSHSSNTDSQILLFCKPFIWIIPDTVAQYCLYNERADIKRGQGNSGIEPLEFVRLSSSVVQQAKDSGSCGVFAFKHAECIISSIPASYVVAEMVDTYRQKVVVDLFHGELSLQT